MKINLVNDLIYYNDEDFFYEHDKIVQDCELPFRESFRTRARREVFWFYNRSGPKVEGVTIWKYADMIIKHNIGKSFDAAFSYYCKKTKGILDAQYVFLQDFEDRFANYFINNEGNIQETEYNLYWKRKRLNKAPWDKVKGHSKDYWENRDKVKKKAREEKRALKNKKYSLNPFNLSSPPKDFIWRSPVNIHLEELFGIIKT